MNAKDILAQAENIKDKLIKTRRQIHSFAETGFDLKATASFVKDELRAIGVEPVDCGKSGVAALVGNPNGKVILLRADMDALPIPEQTDLPFAAKGGNMHACGHDMHTAMLLGAARILKAHESEFCGAVKLMFQPAEEILQGADDMISAGILENPKVDAAMMIHVTAGMSMPTGTVIVSAAGVGAPAADYFEINIQGKGCHGSMPNTGIDPVITAAHILINLQQIQSREIASGERCTLTVGKLHGGTAANVIPDTALLCGTVRSFDDKTHAFIKARITEIAEMTAQTFRASTGVNFTNSCPALLNDAELSKQVGEYVRELVGHDKTVFSDSEKLPKASGSEDFAFISQKVPSVMLSVVAGQNTPPLHHPKVVFDETALSVGAAVYAYTAMRWLE